MRNILKGRNLKLIECVAKVSLLFIVAVFLGEKLFKDGSSVLAIDPGLAGPVWRLMPVIVGMCALNWCLEAARWHSLANPISGINYADSLKGVICGLALSRIFPAGIGECFGRMGYLNSSKRIEASSLVYFGSFIQFLTTVLFGLYGIYHLAKAKFMVVSFATAMIALVPVAFLMVIAIIKIDFGSGSIPHRVKTALHTLSGSTLVRLILLSVGRYLVFSLQLYLLFDCMNLGIKPSITMAGITLIYLSKTILPTFNFLGDLGIREFSAILFFGQFSVNSNLVILPTLVLWLVNILLPSLLGLFLVVKARFALHPEAAN